jgi:hypothetical protein
MPDRTAERSARGIWAGAAVFVVAALLMAPVLAAGFHPEDFGWLALARLSRSPWPLLTHNIDFVYFYRPLPLLAWWFSAHAFGTSAVWHNALDVLLHALNAALVCRLAARVTERTDVGLLAGFLFAALPAGAGTAVWMSDRFDPIALGFSLAALHAFEDAATRGRSPLWSGAWLLCAMLSKEVAYAAAAIMLAWWVLHRLRTRETRMDLLAVVLIVPPLGIALRVLSGTTITRSLEIADPWRAVVDGVFGWWRQAPSALSGFLHAPVFAVGVCVLLITTLFAFARTPRKLAAPASTLLLIGAGLLLLPAALQWPVTAPILIDDGSRAFTENLRFYYAASAGLALLLAAGYAMLATTRARWPTLAVCLACAAFGSALSYQLTAAWARAWRQSSDAYLTLAGELGQKPFPAGCRIYVDAPAWNENIRHHVDTIIKAGAPVNAPVQSCAVFAGEQVYQTFVPADRCTAASWPGLAFSERQGIPIAASVGDVCMLQFATYTKPEQLGAPLFRFRVSADGHAQEIRD